MNHNYISFTGKYERFSNFFPQNILYNSNTFPTAENAFQSAKSKSIVSQLLSCSPSNAKAIGRSCELRKDWEKIIDDHPVKWWIMLDIQRIKYSNEESSSLLLSTEDILLIEYNTWHDNYWGNCLCNKCNNKPGLNNIGKILMQIRSEKKSCLKIII